MKVLNALVKGLRGVVDLIHTYPAVAGMLASVAVTFVAQYGLKVSTADVTTILVAVNGVLFTWVHSQVRPVKATGWIDR